MHQKYKTSVLLPGLGLESTNYNLWYDIIRACYCIRFKLIETCNETYLTHLLYCCSNIVPKSWSTEVHNKIEHNDVIKWKHFLCYWLFVRGIHRSPVNSPHKSQWREALIFSLNCAWINGCLTVVRLVIWDAIMLIMVRNPFWIELKSHPF